jgi:MFS family permease
LLSNLAPANEQGATIGVAQSAGSLARILGPLFAATLYTHIAPLPYVTCGVISILAGILALLRLGSAAEFVSKVSEGRVTRAPDS